MNNPPHPLPKFGHSLRLGLGLEESDDESLFLLNYTNFNHGSFGSCPRPVLQHQLKLRLEQEQQPDLFIRQSSKQYWNETRIKIASPQFWNIPYEQLALVESASTAANSILRSLPWKTTSTTTGVDYEKENDILIQFSTSYGMIQNTAEWLHRHYGIDIVTVPITFPISEEVGNDAYLQPLQTTLENLKSNNQLHLVKVVVLDHIVSIPAVKLPVIEMAQLVRSYCDENGSNNDDSSVFILVDGAHAMGQVPRQQISTLLNAPRKPNRRHRTKVNGSINSTSSVDHRDLLRGDDSSSTVTTAGGGPQQQLLLRTTAAVSTSQQQDTHNDDVNNKEDMVKDHQHHRQHPHDHLIDAYLSNGHKWMYSPKGSAVLWVNPTRITSTFPEPTVISSENSFSVDGSSDTRDEPTHEDPLYHRYVYTSTKDYTSMFSMTAAIDFYDITLGGESHVYNYTRSLALQAKQHLIHVWNTRGMAPDFMEEYMFHVVLPPLINKNTTTATTTIDDDDDDHRAVQKAKELQQWLYDQKNMYVVIAQDPTCKLFYTRLSSQVYLEMKDFVRLGDAVLEFLSK